MQRQLAKENKAQIAAQKKAAKQASSKAKRSIGLPKIALVQKASTTPRPKKAAVGQTKSVRFLNVLVQE